MLKDIQRAKFWLLIGIGSGFGSGFFQVTPDSSIPIRDREISRFLTPDFSLPIPIIREPCREPFREWLFQNREWLFVISGATPDFEKVTPETAPETAPEPTPDPDFSGSGVRIGSDFFSHSRFSLPIPIPIFWLKVTPDLSEKSGVTQKWNFAHWF